ncbi:hypothetical protein, partial [Rhodovulum sulfidophilum]|uniref:hypothetical protein n=1 Tax=Rhodovulum sulfidophilum TaxID=35806 RepID=UPI001EE3EB6F
MPYSLPGDRIVKWLAAKYFFDRAKLIGVEEPQNLVNCNLRIRFSVCTSGKRRRRNITWEKLSDLPLLKEYLSHPE